MRLRNKLIITTSIIGACALATGLFYYHQKVHEVPLPKVTFDAQGGELELYDKEKVNIPFTKGVSWSAFYQDNKLIGSTKDGYDFLYWSLDGENPIPNDYILNEPVTLKPVYVENRDCVTISCRYFDPKDFDVSVTLNWSDELKPGESVLYSYNGGTFKQYNSKKQIELLDQSCYVSFKGTGTVNQHFYFPTEGNSRFAVSGDINALCGHKSLWDNAFSYLFSGSNALVSASGLKLPAATLANYCYSYMFSGCSSLIKAPDLPATTLADHCYNSMFSECSSLVTAPILPATALADYCYSYMFSGCSSLIKAPDLPATSLVDNCYIGIFSNCTSLKSIKISYTGNFEEKFFASWVNDIPHTGGDFYYNGEDVNNFGESAIPGTQEEHWTVHTF